MKHPIFGDDYPENPPDFAVLQNSRTRQTNLWTKERGKWFRVGEDEYDILEGLAKLIRVADNPQELLEGMKFAAKEQNDNDD